MNFTRQRRKFQKTFFQINDNSGIFEWENFTVLINGVTRKAW